MWEEERSDEKVGPLNREPHRYEGSTLMSTLLETGLKLLLALAPFAVFLIFWFAIIAFLLRSSGLRALQQRYPLQRPLGPDFQRLKLKSGRIGSVRFNRILRMQISDEFLIVRLMMPFALSFSGVQIPLAEIEDQGVHGSWIFKYRRLSIAGHNAPQI